MTSKLLLLCAGQRDLRELAASGINAAHMIFHHEYATAALEDLVAPGATNGGAIRDPRAEIADIVATYRGCALNGVISTDDYPGSTLASIVARVLNLPGVDPAADLLCQHKYYSRCLQAKAVPETVPWFARIGTDQKAPAPAGIRYPAFVKPVKSFFSIGASRVDSPDQLAQAIHDNPVSSQFLEPFDTLLQQHLSLAVGAPLIVEDYLPGIQVTLDGFVQRGYVQVMGIVDSIMFPGTISFERFEYPSALERPVQWRMGEIARKVMAAFGFDDGMFNIEFKYDPKTDSIMIIEINPRMSSQFADLYEKVDGFNPYAVMVDLALGRTPALTGGQGRHPLAASCVLRTFADQRVLRIPRAGDVERLQNRYPDIRVEILATEEDCLSSAMQDGNSFRYGLVNIGGEDRQHIQSIFADCRKNLPFKFEPVHPRANATGLHREPWRLRTAPLFAG